MRNSYKPIKPMKEVPDQLRKLRRQFLRYQQAEIVYSLSHKKLFELASDAGAIYRFDSTVLIISLPGIQICEKEFGVSFRMSCRSFECFR